MSKEKLVPKLRFEHFKNAEYWTNFELGELANIVRGASPRPIQDPKWFDKDSTVGWLRISDVTRQNGRIYYLDQRISKAGQEKTRVLKSPHLLISIAATVGKPVINYVDTGVHDGFLIFKDPIFDKEFMYQWLEMFRLNWFRYGQPGSQINLNSNLVKNQNVYLPLLQEQEKIGKFFVKLDEMIQLQQSKVNKVKDIKSAYLSEMFPKEGEQYPKRRFEGFIEPWEEYKMKDMGRSLTGLSGKSKKDFGHGEAEFVTYMNVFNNPIAKSTQTAQVEIDENQTEVEYGDIFFTVSSETPNEVGMSSVWLYDRPNVYLNSFCFGFRPNIKLNPYYMAYMLRSPEIRKRFILLAQGISRYNISKTKAMELLFPIPSNEEQEKIGQFFKNLDKQITIEEGKLSKLEKLKQAYLNDMFV